MNGLDVKHLLEMVVRPALREMDHAPSTVYGGAAEQLVVTTAAKESNLRWLRQLSGPAVGLWQMEPFTFNDIRDRFIKTQPYMWNAFGRCSIALRPEAGELAYNLKLAALCCRIKYLMSSHPLPERGDIAGMAQMWKSVYNTELGAGKPEEFIRAWETQVAPANLKWSL